MTKDKSTIQPETIEVELPENQGIEKTTIRSTDELPTWFTKAIQSNAYTHDRRLSELDWFHELYIRACYYSLFDVTTSIDPFHQFASDEDTRRKIQRRKSLFFGASASFDLPSDKTSNNTKISFSYSERKQAMLSDALKNYAGCSVQVQNEIIFTGLISKKIPGISSWKLIDNCKFLPNWNETFSVDLLAPDKTVNKQFKEWLKDQRLKVRKEDLPDAKYKRDRSSRLSPLATNKGVLPTLTAAKLDDWFKCGLLPFLDLHQWALLYNVDINQPVYADALSISPKQISETTYKHAHLVMEYIAILRNQIKG